MNIVILSGNLGDDPESRYSSEGMHIAQFSMAFTSSKNKTGWIKVTCFDKIADVAVNHLHKGAKIAVTGALDQEKWTTDNNETRTATKLIARGIDFIKTDGRGFDNTKDNGNADDIPF
jgi:single-strand DNA-binding protein